MLILHQIRSSQSSLEYQTYVHEKIKSTKEIRLFRFRKTKNINDISVKIEHVPVDDLPLYECLSYTWGDLAVRKQIYCDGYTISVTVNLWDALNRIRARVDRRRLFWADQICINQKDTEEKSAQVGMMSSIFPFAARVLCWLGEEDEHTKIAFDVIQTWEKAEKDEDLRRRLGQEWSSDSGHKSPHQLDQEQALASFYSRAWFRRTWTLQEVFVPSTQAPIVIWGTYDIDWHTVCMSFFMLNNTLSLEDATAIMGTNVDFVLPMFSVYFQRGKRSIRLSRLLFQTARREARDPRDRIFALLGIMKHEHFVYPEPDYDLSTKQVFAAYTRAIIEQEESLEVLTPGLERWSNEEDMPTWVLSREKASISKASAIGSVGGEAYRESGVTGKTKPIFATASSTFDEELQLYGLKCDRIVKLCDLQPVVSKLLSSKKKWQNIFNQICDVTRSLGLEPKYEYTGEDIAVACAKTLVTNDFYVGCTQPTRNYDSDTARLYSKFLRRTVEPMGSNDANTAAGAERDPDTPWTERSLHELSQRLFTFDTPVTNRTKVEATTPLVTQDTFVDWLDASVSSDLTATMDRRAAGSNLAVTATGLLALVPTAASVDDEVCLLMGGLLPFVLSPTANDGKQKLVGEAYVHGLMDGRSARQCEKLYKEATVGDFSALTKFCLI